jgi:RIO-like serine/threonine protein kinase
MSITRTLKTDGLGTVSLIARDGARIIERDTRAARRGARWLARRLAAREAAILETLGPSEGLPELIDFDGAVLRRTFLPGEPLYAARPSSRAFFARALKLLRHLHRHGVVHNDLAKEANWLCGPGDRPAIIDFQLACRLRRRGKLFRVLAREDLRHLLKHKQTYFPEALTARQRAVLAAPAFASRLWRALWKPGYLLITRRVLGWPERRGPIERQS